MLELRRKYFEELTTDELYDLLQLRGEVFIVEQACIYQDVDGRDRKAMHILGYKNNKLIAYTRAFKQGDYFKEASIGRVVVVKDEREHKYGYDIMLFTINAIEEEYNASKIKVSAQTYLKKFYNNLNFKAVGEEYLEDDIPHIAMVKG